MHNRFKKITSYQEILERVQKNKTISKNILTNFFLDEIKTSQLINLGILQLIELDEAFFILKEEDGFFKVFYNATNENSLLQGLRYLNSSCTDKILQFEIIGKGKDITLISAACKQVGLYEYSSMIRMSKAKENSIELNDVLLLPVNRIQDLKKQFDDFFDKFVEQIPTIEELKYLIEKEYIIFISDDDITIQGFLIYEIKGFTSHLRYWFVNPKYRNKKMGSIMLKHYLGVGLEVKRQILWVIKTNDNAIKKYEHYGFKTEDLHNIIFINKNLKYDTTNH